MIVVMPNARNAFDGSFYTNSPVTGNWEQFIVRDLVNYVDHKYRTLRTRKARGLAGHSMGGYGALRIGMRHPETFSAVYALSAYGLAFTDSVERAYDKNWRTAMTLTDWEQFAKRDSSPTCCSHSVPPTHPTRVVRHSLSRCHM